MKRNTMNFAVKTLSFALFFTLFLFSGRLAAEEGCHTQNGCGTDAHALYNSTPFANPTYSPSWTEATATMGRVRGGQYLKFSVVEGEIYQWSTEGKEDAFGGNYASTCTTHNICRTGSDITTQGLRCIGGYCLLPFDTELTLLKGESCSADSELLAYSNAGGFRNQSQIEWKADFTGTVVLLVTNFAYNASEDAFVGCQLTEATSADGWDMTTTVKWHRAASEHCTTCDNKNLYKFNYDPTNEGAEVLTLDDENRAPNWQSIQTKDSVNLVDFELSANNTWAKPGSYFTFNVVEDQIYRWSTCIAEFQDTQLTLFKGDKNDAGDGCGEFLAYGDDSKVSYVYNDQTYCPAGTKQTVLEWKANFSGKVTLLMNEYNCSQCYPIEIPLPGGEVRRDWLNCFVEVDGQVYPFPLDWQRYDCDTCEGSPAFTIADNSTSFEGSKELSAGQSIKFSLKRGSKYLFKASDPTAIITVKKGDSCDGKLLAQETGQLAYFANVDTTGLNMSNYTYSDDVITVFVSKADCRPGANTLTYSYYGSDTVANISNRFSVIDFAGSMVVTDNSTTLQFVDTGEWAKTWKEAIQKCQAKTVGEGSAEETIPCPKPQCPYTFKPIGSGSGYTYVGSMLGSGMSGTLETDPHYNDANSENTDYFCKYISAGGDANGKCKPPKCATNFAEYQKTAANQHDEDKQDLFGKCYYSGSECNNTVLEAVEGPRDPRYWDENPNPCIAAHKSGTNYYCDEGYIWRGTQALGLGNYNNKRCCPCPSGFEFGREGYPTNKCFKFRNACDENQNCIDQNTECSYLATVKDVCPAGYTEQSDGRCKSDDEVGYNVYDDVVEANPVLGTFYSQNKTCPYSTNSVGEECDYSNCFKYVYEGDIQDWWNGSENVKVDKSTGTDTMYGKYPRCYKTSNKTGSGRCCATGDKIVINDGGETGEIIAASDFYYATATNSNGTVASAEKWKALEPTCPSGYNYELSNGKCGRCGSGYSITWEGEGDEREYRCVKCSKGEFFNGKCQTCNTGYTLGHTGGEGGTDPEYYCKKECPSDAYQYEEDGNIKCYTNISDKVERCNTDNDWIEEPGRPGRCRKLQKAGDDYINVACGADIDAKDNEPGRTCDFDNMNSYDCDCVEDRCEDQTKAVDAKVCPNPYQVSYRCGGGSFGGGVSRICYHEYVTTPEYMPYTLPSGETVQVVKTCHYTDSTGQACGEEMGGWTLPNLNQLYSIVDFDLYDPATAYPLKGAYIRTENNGDCYPVPSSGTDCETADECGVDEICIGNKCTSADPYGDMQCDEDGKYICDVNTNKCVRNNWYWSSTTVVSENINDGSFTWAVNMEDGRTYRARKGCDGTDCLEDVDLNARPHHVICIKGSSVSGIFDNDKPSKEQVFSGWACDKNDEPTSLKIYFEITDKNSKDVVDLLGESEYIMTIPGLLHKGIKYGATDITPTGDEDTKATEIYNNCGFPTNPKPHAFEIKWKDGEFTAGKEDIADLIRTIADIECSDDRLADGADPKLDCAVPPYFVTAYGVNETSAAVSAVAISPTERPFVLKNRCGDGYMTYDGEYTETCESQNFNGICAYGNDECNLCAEEEKTVSGTKYEACTYYPANPPRCMDGTIQSYYCEDGIIADGHPGAGLSCEYYNFAASNNVAASEQCDCAGTQNDLYLYNADGTYTCSSASKLSAKVCPNYFTQASADAGEDRFCYICSGCKKEKVDRAFCGDSKIQRSNCAGYANCETVPGADEECDDGNNSDTDNCTTKCKLPQCGDGAIQPALGEICDSGDRNGFYATNCVGTEACPGCASITCGKPDSDGNDTDPFGPRCGDGIVQNKEDSCNDPTFITTYGPLYGFTSQADCEKHLEGAEEKCDRGNLNGAPISFADFVNTAEGAGCADTISGAGSDKYPVNALQKKYLECVYKYKQYIDNNSGCAADCKTPVAPYCGDGVKDAGETCDEGLPTVNLVSGNYVIAAASAGKNYNGKGYGHCRLDCKATYKCDDDILDGECAGAATEGYCTSLGFVENGKINLYVKDANEYCDDGALNGSYGHCDEGCGRKSYCGNANLNCIEKDGSGNCIESEECDNGSSGGNPNKPIDKAYSKEQYGSCISEDEACKGEASFWGERVCCKYGRYCGDGTVDNSSLVGDGINWKDPSKWTVSGGTVTYDARKLSLRFELTAEEATAELSVPIPIDLNLRYLLEYNVKYSSANSDIQAGANEYDASGSKLTNATYSNASPYFFTQLYSSADGWYRGKNPFAIRDESQGAASDYHWYLGTKTVRIFFKMTADSGSYFFIKSLSFYNIENASYSYLYDGSTEMCDPGTQFFKTSSTFYMTDCDSGCNWINYCGDSVVQRNNNDCPSGTYNGYPCVDNITYAEEECDNGTNGANEYGGCEPGCRKIGPHCGDGFVDSKSCPSGSESWCNTPSSLVVAEQCDNGSANSNIALGNFGVTSLSNYGTCREDCRVSRCGDGILDGVRDADGNLIEECDCGAPGAYFELTKNQKTTVNGKEIAICMTDGGDPIYNTLSAQRAAVCRPNCKISRCGDGILDRSSGEECDDGNFNDFDSCTKDCKLNRVGDGIYAHGRSYLCEELQGLDAAHLTKLAAKGVVDCGGAGQMTCDDMKTTLTTEDGVKTQFEQGRLHCCYNQKFNAMADDHNCEIRLDGEYFKPKDLIVDRCVKYAFLGNEYEGNDETTVNKKKAKCDAETDEVTGKYTAIELCEHCINNKCDRTCDDGDEACKTQRTENCKHLATQTERDKCMENNTYCDATGWNIIGRCGDGKVDTDAGEICDNNVSSDDRKYTDLYNSVVSGGGGWSGSYSDGRHYDGHYCTGECKGACSETSPICGSVTNNCWQKGCTVQAHRSGASSTETSSCGDGFVDDYAGEECDYGANKHTGSWSDSYCNTNCKYNRKGSASGAIAKCGDGQIQSKNEICDDGNTNNDDYCVADSYGVGCQVSYGSCGDTKITGPGYTSDNKWDDGTLTGGAAGPEDCDINDSRTQSLLSAGVQLSKLCNATTCKRVGSCGDGTRDPRFEGCDNGSGNNTSNITKDGVTCFKGCKSNPKGSLMKATNSEINGWACDPDHPMTHPATLVRIEIYDSSSPVKEVGRKLLATTKDIAGRDVSTDAYWTLADIAKECGGGSKHGWTFDPSKSDTAMNWEGKTAPFTVKVYATSLDGSPETEVKIGEKQFVRSMMCGDGLKSSCSSIEVTFPPASEGADATTALWANGKVCHDSEVLGTCADYGLTDGEACVDEECDKGSANGNDKDCSATCKWTKCGDNVLQANATGIRPDGTSAEECEGSEKKNCTLLLEKEVNTDAIANQASCYGTNNPKCKWNKTNCKITSNCPALSTGISDWGSPYVASNVSAYITPKNGTTYTRYWTGTGTKGWGDRETKVKYDTVASTDQEKACSYKCTDKFKWDNSKCVPKTDIEISCSSCSDVHGVWLKKNDDGTVTASTSSCKTAAKTIKQKVTLNSDGSVTCVPGDCTISAAPNEYGTALSDSKCIWTCDNDSKWSSTAKTCLANSKSFTCSGKPDGTHWMSVIKDGSGKIVVTDKGNSMTVTQTLDGATLTYSPSDSTLAALDINNGSNSPKQLYQYLGSEPIRCYYGCPSGSYYENGSCKETKCGDGIVNTTDCSGVSAEYTCKFTVGRSEVCDDGSANGTYAGVATGSNCKSDCSGKIKGGSEYFCGDKVVQYKSGNTCYGSACKQVTEGNYPGATVSAFGTSEQCDPKSNANDRATLCKSKGYGDHSYYNNTNSVPKCENDCKITISQYESCAYCGDGKVQRANDVSYVTEDYKNVANADEYCDPGRNYSNASGRQELCNIKLNQDRSDYYDLGSFPICGSNCTKANITANKGEHCQYCGDGVHQSSKEQCDSALGFSATCHIQNGSYECNCSHGGTNCSSCPKYDHYTVSCDGYCKYKKTYSSGGNTGTTGQACSYYGL